MLGKWHMVKQSWGRNAVVLAFTSNLRHDDACSKFRNKHSRYRVPNTAHGPGISCVSDGPYRRCANWVSTINSHTRVKFIAARSQSNSYIPKSLNAINNISCGLHTCVRPNTIKYATKQCIIPITNCSALTKKSASSYTYNSHCL